MRSYLRTPEKRKKYLLALGDGVLITGVLFFIFLIQIGLRGRLGAFFAPIRGLEPFAQVVAFANLLLLFLGFSLFFVLVYLTIFYVFGLYDMEFSFNRKAVLAKVGAGVLIGTIVLLGLLNIVHKRLFFTEVWALFGISLIVVLFLWRFFYSTRLSNPERYGVVFCGKDSLSEKAIAHLSTNGAGKLFQVKECSEQEFMLNHSHESGTKNARYDLIVYPFMKSLSQEHLMEMVKQKFEGLKVISSLNFYKNVTGSFPVFELSAQWLVDLSMSLGLANQFQKRVKRFVDIVFSGVGVLVSLPLMLIIAVAIKLTSKGLILFAHERLGLNRKPFTLYKFRTMMENAEAKTGPVWAQKDDPRVTAVGGFLRKTRLDELPQFLNVLKGDMSFVGPRPIRQYFADKLTKEFPYYFLRFYVKPGLTGWAQVSGDYGETVEGQLRKLEYELFYIHEYSLLLDAVIILKTVQRVFTAKGQ